MKQTSLLSKSISLRRKGFSLREISESLNISKSTASLWLRQTKVNKKGQVRIIKIGDDGRKRGVDANKQKRQIRWQKVADETLSVKSDLSDYNIDQLKLLLAMLYWGEGAKTIKRLDFMNSDPAMIKAYLFLLRKCFKIQESKLKPFIHLHEYHNQSEIINFWAGITGIDKNKFSVYRKGNTGKRKKIDYRGCLSLRYSDVNIFDEVMIIIDRFQQAIK